MAPTKEQLEKASESGLLSRIQNVQLPPGDAEGMPNQDATASHSRTYLGQGTKINGKLSCQAPVHIDGQIEGEIDAYDTSVMIGESAVVTAKIKAVSVTVLGVVNGDISASQRVELQPSAKVSGNITMPKLVMHEGAQFEGKSTMQPKAAREDRKPETSRKEERLGTETKGQQPVGQI